MTREEIENIPKNVNTLLDLSVTMHTRQKLDEKLNKVCELAIKALEQEKTGHCKDCKWWKDSDGEYRRGVRAESKCPINTKTVYLGNGYCYKFEPKAESEE